ncbi:hypothetical protein WN55_10879 [Dufourea novaeangliae]|uniref:Uncharacterized protein n=1 Tax=Dufourea novaeangliae TaxID=178035 RepID=A0A154P8D3_DUFNO|nr:hypothetical protein WN55_10879 [Dufourea novaeangliae]
MSPPSNFILEASYSISLILGWWEMNGRLNTLADIVVPTIIAGCVEFLGLLSLDGRDWMIRKWNELQ